MSEFSLSHVIILFLIIGMAIFPIVALVDVANSTTNKNKTLWVLIIYIGNIFGASLYWLVGRKPKVN